MRIVWLSILLDPLVYELGTNFSFSKLPLKREWIASYIQKKNHKTNEITVITVRGPVGLIIVCVS